MLRFSIIVPYAGDIHAFEDTLASVLRYRPVHSEVIVAHDGSYLDHYQLHNEVRFAVTSRKAQLIRLFNAGVREAEGEVVAFLRPGVQLDENWDVPLQAAFRDPNVGSASPIVVSPLKPSRIVAAGIDKEFGFCRKLIGHGNTIAPRRLRALKPLGPTSWAAFYRREVLSQIGTCDEQLDPVYLDLDLALAMANLGYECRFVPGCTLNMDRVSPLVRESSVAHGKSAERATRRHSVQSSLGTTVFTIAAELFRAPLRPWLVQHALQRIGANRMADIDRHFSEKIRRAVRQRKWEQGAARKAA